MLEMHSFIPTTMIILMINIRYFIFPFWTSYFSNLFLDNMAKITGLHKVVWCFCNQVSFSHYSSSQHPLHLGMGCGCWLALNVKGDSLSLWPVSVFLSQLPLPCSDVSLQQAAGQWQLTSWLPLLCGSAQWFSAAWYCTKSGSTPTNWHSYFPLQKCEAVSTFNSPSGLDII